jgi:hypothetical protein
MDKLFECPVDSNQGAATLSIQHERDDNFRAYVFTVSDEKLVTEFAIGISEVKRLVQVLQPKLREIDQRRAAESPLSQIGPPPSSSPDLAQLD